MEEVAKRPFFSIIIPVYNVAPYLRECLDSVLAQTFLDWEAICVDDGSTDESGAILDEYAAKDRRFRVFHQPNAGVSAARNKALDEAKGEWIGFLDADDMIASEWLYIANGAVVEDIDILRMLFQEFDGVRRNPDPLFAHSLRGAKHDKYWGLNVFLKHGWGWLCFLRRSLLNNQPLIRFKDGLRLREDMLFLSQCVLRANSIVQLDYRGYFYRVVDNSASRNEKLAEDIVSFLDGLRGVIEIEPAPFGSNDLIRGTLGKLVSDNITEWICEGRCNDALDDKKIYAAVKWFYNHNLWSEKDLPVRWRFGGWCMLHTGWFGPLRTSAFLFSVARYMKHRF